MDILVVASLKIIGTACLMIATKFHSTFDFSASQAAYMIATCEEEVPQLYSLIKQAESTVMHLLEFRLGEPTAFDFATYMLYLSNENYDFSEITLQVLEVTNACFLSKFPNCLEPECLRRFRQSSIAVASTLLTLKHNHFNTFIPQWKEFLKQSFEHINWEEVDKCEKFILVNFTDQS